MRCRPLTKCGGSAVPLAIGPCTGVALIGRAVSQITDWASSLLLSDSRVSAISGNSVGATCQLLGVRCVCGGVRPARGRRDCDRVPRSSRRMIIIQACLSRMKDSSHVVRLRLTGSQQSSISADELIRRCCPCSGVIRPVIPGFEMRDCTVDCVGVVTPESVKSCLAFFR